MTRSRFFNWVFYGHIWIALAATGLSWLTLRLVYENQDYASEWPVLTFIFFATLGVYTLHRYLSFQRAGVRPTSLRYEIVSKHPQASLIVGFTSMLIAGGIGLTFIGAIWYSLLWALPLTVFYLTPPIKGWRRLRDLPYVKVIWVAWAWTIMTVVVPVSVVSAGIEADYPRLMGSIIPQVSPAGYGPDFGLEQIIRFLFTGTIALLFDLRDVELDRSQEVKTVANDKPVLHRLLVAVLLVLCAILAFYHQHYAYDSDYLFIALASAYLLMLPVAFFTYRKTDENWYAVVVNGLLLLPPFVFALVYYLGGDAGAGGGL
jgi:hypothetical protein